VLVAHTIAHGLLLGFVEGETRLDPPLPTYYTAIYSNLLTDPHPGSLVAVGRCCLASVLANGSMSSRTVRLRESANPYSGFHQLSPRKTHGCTLFSGAGVQ